MRIKIIWTCDNLLDLNQAIEAIKKCEHRAGFPIDLTIINSHALLSNQRTNRPITVDLGNGKQGTIYPHNNIEKINVNDVAEEVVRGLKEYIQLTRSEKYGK